MKYEGKPIEKENFLPLRKRHIYHHLKEEKEVDNTEKINNIQSLQQINHNSTILPYPKEEENKKILPKEDIKPQQPYQRQTHPSQDSQDKDEDDEKTYCICNERYNANLRKNSYWKDHYP
jgi:hypothetical protein